MCLTPLSVSNAFSVIGGVGGGTFDELVPCLTASCGLDLPLGGGFDLTNVALHAGSADLESGDWGICGAATGEPSAWNVSAQCVVAQGDVFVVTGVFPFDDDELGCREVECPAGTSLVGGGGRWGSNLSVNTSEPTVDGLHWEVCGGGLGDAPQLEVDAYCAVLPDGASTEVVEETQLVDSETLGCAQANCPQGTALAGGGSGGLVAATFEVSQPAVGGAQGWLACGRANLVTGEIRSRVLCYQP